MSADVSTEVTPYAGLAERDYFHIMLNLDSFESFRPTARALAEGYLAAARQRLAGDRLEPELRAFPYTPQALEARMDLIYQGLVDDVARYEAKRSWTLRTREDVVEWLLQMAPFNQTDGAWLRNIAPVGPLDDVGALLFGIYIEELGKGDAWLNHANVYTELLRSVDVVLPEIRSRAYADNPELVDSAFTVPLFQLVVSEFSQDFRPELLGMTLYLEWSSVELRNMVRLHEYLGLDPHFYELHVAIDNAASGHGAQALRAVRLYLERIRTTAGDEALQEYWERVWVGYVAFATTGTLGQDVAARRQRLAGPAQKVAALVRERAPKARLNHGRKELGGRLINDLFAEPEELMAALVASRLVVAGDPEASPFFDLLTSDGPMFMIFTEPEIQLWREWVRSLAAVPAAPATAAASLAEEMARLVDALRPRQVGTPAHAGTKLAGPDPADPEASVEQPVARWFEQPALALLRALRTPANGWWWRGSRRRAGSSPSWCAASTGWPVRSPARPGVGGPGPRSRPPGSPRVVRCRATTSPRCGR